MSTYSPLAAGLLSGTMLQNSQSARSGSRFYTTPHYMDLYYTERNFKVVELLRGKATELGLPMTRLAMAWVLSNTDVTAMLVGADTPEQLDEAIAAYLMEFDLAVFEEMSAWGGGELAPFSFPK